MLRRALWLTLLAALAAPVFPVATSSGSTYTTVRLSSLRWIHAYNGWGPVERNESNGGRAAGDGRTITINGRRFARGLGGHAYNEILFKLPANCIRLTGYVGIDDEVDWGARRWGGGTAIFEAWVPDPGGSLSAYGRRWKNIFLSGRMTYRMAAKLLSVSIAGRSHLLLLARGTRDGRKRDHVDWAMMKLTCSEPAPTPTPPPAPTSSPPRAGGYFSLKPVGSWSSLPSGEQCKSLIRYSTWEPRPWNTKRNSVVPDKASVSASFASHKRSGFGTYDTRWDSWLLPRVDGNFTGTTDEILQWAACKWGLPDDVVRSVAFRESTWHQYLTYQGDPGRCVEFYGCGDVVDDRIWCETARTRGGYDYQQDYAWGRCPGTFSIMGVRSQDSSRSDFTDHSNGTFPFNRNSTAFAADYFAASMRGCYEGWQWWLKNTGRSRTGEQPYGAGDLWGCIGSWYAGSWRTDAANGYAAKVQASTSERPWLHADFPNWKPRCHATYGCPGPDPL